ncbi:MAG: response regulator [Deltaproteobacteria bacterium]|nr:response regulator [Deltaproteobacteria bacterium]
MLVDVSQTDILKLAEIIRAETGNQVAEKNHSMIISRIRTRLLKLTLKSMSSYWTYFAEHETDEREVLRNLMTTHYTFFFREYVHFEILQQWIHSNAQRLKDRYLKTQTPVRIWSAACSRGHEVYSLASFLELELKTKYSVPYEVLGSDIDSESVQHAGNGVYPLKEVNTIPQAYLSRFWKKGTGAVKDFAAAHPTIREKVSFEVVNLLELKSWANPHLFDVIFCRNVFIYFSEENVRQIATSLEQRLDPAGLFVSGLSEPVRFPGWDLKTVGPSCYSRQSEVRGSKPAEVTTSLTERTTQPSPVQITAAGRYKVLCVDDSNTIQILMKKIFSMDPDCERVDSALNGREAREMLDKNQYSLITLDIHMPEVNGIEFLETLYDRKTDPPVIMVSSVNRTDLDLATKSVSLGAFDYVEKPAMNNLQKSSQEILTKAKMAIRTKTSVAAVGESGFDESIGQKIVVPDASMCLRLVAVSLGSAKEVALAEQIVRGQRAEYRSPPILIWNVDGPVPSHVMEQVLRWTDRSVSEIRAGGVLKPNGVFLASGHEIAGILEKSRAKTLSLQFVTVPQQLEWRALLGRFVLRQVLLDESHIERKGDLERMLGLTLSDISPATSFASLSVEFFANLRKAAA